MTFQPPPPNTTLMCYAHGSIFFGFYSPLLDHWFMIEPGGKSPSRINPPQRWVECDTKARRLIPEIVEKQLLLF
jgi:hypothetical protein